MDPRVTVIIPVYKVELFLEKCVRSIINQSYQNLEIILIDDGSPDNSPKMCDEFAIEDDRIKVIHKNNEGVTKARIDGFKAATSEYIMFVDADDTLEKNAVKELIGLMKKFDTDVTVCQVNICLESKSFLQHRPVRSGYYTKENIENLLKTNFLYDNHAHRSGFQLYLWGKLYRKDQLIDKLEKGIGFWYGEDMVSMLSIINEVQSMYISEKALYNYFQSTSQVTRKPFEDLLPQYEKVWEYFHNTDYNDYFISQLPNRAWYILISALRFDTKNTFDNYLIVFKLIRKSNTFKNYLLHNKYITGTTNKIYRFLINNNFSLILYYLQKYDIAKKLYSKFK